MWDTQHLSTLEASTACYGVSFAFSYLFSAIDISCRGDIQKYSLVLDVVQFAIEERNRSCGAVTVVMNLWDREKYRGHC
jgi:hypothetical protein